MKTKAIEHPGDNRPAPAAVNWYGSRPLPDGRLRPPEIAVVSPVLCDTSPPDIEMRIRTHFQRQFGRIIIAESVCLPPLAPAARRGLSRARRAAVFALPFLGAGVCALPVSTG